ncbi:uncharacterized protein FA14DRAFT_177398 [Meira miltonrushii]|uniref:ditrans,polycis-polyprenyl diphosphate synthase [(2E,6E)-farnesyldiphosphate specific] n=1 Tax=Meira miltonrushii TaxID=1280837 RepID=A0A316VKX7_9BASI|nr:uncharacterized protein FA14DRAFT_177398 [Meira miltonrushii]PWN38120.1 hypothetical protein FA14DRAFT_177398 [Meira miltonrushii]
MSVQLSHAMANGHDDSGVMNGMGEKKADKTIQPLYTSQRRRSIGQSRARIDPMTLSIKLIVYPILFLALLLVHLVYYVSIKARASWRYQRSIIAFMRSDERLNRTIKGKKAYKKEKARIEEQHELAAQVRLARMECMGRTNVPRHIALSIGPKPIRTSTLLLRAMKISARILSMRMTSWIPNKAKELYEQKANIVAEARQQEKYAWDNLEAALRNCALSGIRELSVYDIEGYLANRFSETQKEVIEQVWRLPQESIEDEELIEGETAFLPNGNSAQKLDRKHIQITATIYRPFRAPTLHDIYRRPSLTPHKDGHHSVQVRINILGPEDGRQALAKAATILSKRQKKSSGPCKVGENQVRDVLAEHGYPSDPELLIIHGGPRQVSTLHAFPPWLVRLCEIYHDADASPYQPLSSTSFEKALHAFAKSEQRLGK